MDRVFKRTAVISSCQRFRYRLDREIAMVGRRVLWIGVNPSTADADVDDATIRKMRGFSHGLGASRFMVGNLFAYRATDVRKLSLADTHNHSVNDAHLALMAAEADLVIVAWGNRDKIPQRMQGRIADVYTLLLDYHNNLHCLGKTKSGDPKHPLMLGYATELEAYP